MKDYQTNLTELFEKIASSISNAKKIIGKTNLVQ